ncbi:protein-methionine-sulfoxide reductase heme-binding subunit MsrQ [Gemmatimonas sp.]|uniref:sulfite oxidase heme-binding subunit YedZ n=1 Tax=Gemmatimonas sp. TaxID=1962908 RepID=UPI0025C10CB4|nr:protein-methionine-sulfoxide reductase heme-binding subunit MsrQ [Gemmatimonas sp.]
MRPDASRAERTVRRFIRPALWALVLAPAPLLIAQLLLDQLGADPIDRLERLTGEWALRFLIASLAVTPLLWVTGWGWLVAQRRFLGLAAFCWTVGHLAVYTVLDWFFDWQEIIKDVTEHLYITLGMAAFLLLVPLALTSTKGAIRRLGGARWTRLHSLVYVAVIAACLHFAWAVKKDLLEPILYGGLAAVLLAVRVLRKAGARTA